MNGFNEESYKSMVNDLINDIFYNETGSDRGKISTIRQYAEVIVRKILNLSHTEYVTLGKREIVNELKRVSSNNFLLMDSLNKLRIWGNDTTHTQYINEVGQEELEECKSSLINLYAYLYIHYFEKYKFGKDLEILSSFSILPPIVRYTVLNYLYKKYPNNLDVIDKFGLAILKAFGKIESKQWLDENKELLKELSCISEEGKEALIQQHGELIAQNIIENAPKDMYELCLDKINDVEECINTNGLLYKNFEEAIKLYKEKGHVFGESDEIKEFNSIMQFVYLGREAIQNDRLQDLDKYMILA